ncbi:hypothetical protein ABZ608_34110 [Streptomyces sp. NPDC013172]|uniref:hypothetical protein n=1 Tax=Streptomyces sp. NPDC013172 TaxID=3155009 RepID=UPI0034109102
MTYPSAFFGRINVRYPGGVKHDSKAFGDLVQRLEASDTWHERASNWDSWAVIANPKGMREAVEWKDFLLPGVVAYSKPYGIYKVRQEPFRAHEGVLAAPFIIDTRSTGRWLAIAPQEPLSARVVSKGLHYVLQSVTYSDTMWDIDLVWSVNRIRDWLRFHGRVEELAITLRYPNPYDDLSEDLAALIELKGQQEQRIMTAPREHGLDIKEKFLDKLAKLGEKGLIDVAATATTADATDRFDTRDFPDQDAIRHPKATLQEALFLLAESFIGYLHKRGLSE